jgi:Flp pilus assembly protein TadD
VTGGPGDSGDRADNESGGAFHQDHGLGGAARPSDEVRPLLERALGHAEDGEWDEAAQLLRDGLEEHGDDPHVLAWLGLAERELGLEGVAYERFKAALALEPRDPFLLATAGTALARFDDPEAETVLRTAALTAPDLPRARWMYGAYLSREGFLKEARDELEAAVELDPEDPVILLELGVALALSDELPMAEAAFAQSAELDPGDGWALVLLGLARVEGGEPDDALQPLEEGARLRPDDLEAQLLAALALSGEGWEDRALEMLERARLRAGPEADQAFVLEVEERIEEGGEGALRFLRETLAPSSFRERLMQRP